MHQRPTLLALLCCLAAAGCGGSDGSPAPVTVTLTAPGDSDIREADDRTVRVALAVDSTDHSGFTVFLNFSGTATRDRDYAVSADSITIAPNSGSAGVDIDVYRDFDREGDETIMIGLGTISGNAQPGAASSVTLTVIDGESAEVVKERENEEESGFAILPAHFTVTATSVSFGVSVLNFPVGGAGGPRAAGPTRLFAEWSTDFLFETDVHLLGEVDIPPADPDVFTFPEPHTFTLPLDALAPNESYYVRAYLDGFAAVSRVERQEGDLFLTSFATDEEGRFKARCEAPARPAGGSGPDPLFAEQWHLGNTGQSAFARSGGKVGADLRMDAAIDAGHDGAGVKLAVVDSGLEVCHPDLAANIEEGKSFNFRAANIAGASPTDPFNYNVDGDHGTGVAGIAAAVANNGLGGRGVASRVQLRGFNFGDSLEFDPEVILMQALGTSTNDPDSASVDLFNMSFGVEIPAGNPSQDFVRLIKKGTADLRGGRGALYIKAAGNEFEACYSPHPLNEEIGCIGSNADRDQNLPYLVTVGGFNADDVKSSYSNAGANLWVVAPAGEYGDEHPAMITTDQAGLGAGLLSLSDSGLAAGHPLNPDGDYVSNFNGTSSAAPAAAGAVAILLGLHPDLTWRDVKHVLAASTRKIDPDRPRVRAAFNGQPYVAQHAWQTNGAGYDFHNWYGFGAVAVDDAVAMAATHTPDSLGEFVESPWFEPQGGPVLTLDIPDADGAGVTASLEVTNLPEGANIEAATLEVSVDHTNSADLGITLTSPAGAHSVVNAPFNALLDGFPGLPRWQLMSNAFYGEAPNGTWTLRVVDLAEEDTGHLTSWRLRFHYGDHPG